MSHAKPSNPYQAPASEQLETSLSNQLAYKGFGLVIASTFIFGIGGALIGLLLGLITPAYYESVFDLALADEAWQVGLGLGLTQGLVCGIIVGCVVLLASAWYRSRIRAGLLPQIQALEKQQNAG